jgi:hypothetical protein
MGKSWTSKEEAAILGPFVDGYIAASLSRPKSIQSYLPIVYEAFFSECPELPRLFPDGPAINWLTKGQREQLADAVSKRKEVRINLTVIWYSLTDFVAANPNVSALAFIPESP